MEINGINHIQRTMPPITSLVAGGIPATPMQGLEITAEVSDERTISAGEMAEVYSSQGIIKGNTLGYLVDTRA